jgi:hypothetical protein
LPLIVVFVTVSPPAKFAMPPPSPPVLGALLVRIRESAIVADPV